LIKKRVLRGVIRKKRVTVKHANTLLIPDNRVSGKRHRKGGTYHEEKRMFVGCAASYWNHGFYYEC
jgi:hypothetical protein